MTTCPDCDNELDEPGSADDPQLQEGNPRGRSVAVDASGEADRAEPDRCPTCGHALQAPDQTRPKAPWHFKVLLAGSVIYLGWRLYQGIGWLVHHA